MPLTRFGIEAPATLATAPPEVRQYVDLLRYVAEQDAMRPAANPFDPRTWQIQTYVALFGLIGTVLLWAFNSGGTANRFENRLAALETNTTTFARNDVTNLKLDNLTAAVNELKSEVEAMRKAGR